MDVLTSTEFRKVYAALRRPTYVTVNGHIIGMWQPTLPVDIVGESPAKRSPAYFPDRKAMTQAQRDAILRKVNRTGRSSGARTLVRRVLIEALPE